MHACTSTFASDDDSYPQDRLELVEHGNIYTGELADHYPNTWKPTLAADVDLMLNTIASDTPPDDCLIGQVWIDTNATSGQRVNTCELVTGTPTWVAQAGGGGSGDITKVGTDCTSGDCFVSGGTGTTLESDSNFIIKVDANNNSTLNSLFIENGTGGPMLTINEANGNASHSGSVS